MANSVWQATIQNAAGDIVPGAEITVIDEGTGLNAVIYSSKAGAALTNPFNADTGGFAQFYSGPGEYRITAFDIGTGLTQTFDNWRLGDAGARDTGTAAGYIPLSEDVFLDDGNTNWTSGNMQPNTSLGLGAIRIMQNVRGSDVPDGGPISGSFIKIAFVDTSGVMLGSAAAVSGTWKNISGINILDTKFGYMVRTA